MTNKLDILDVFILIVLLFIALLRSAVKDLIVQNLVKYGSARSAEVVNKIEESPVVSSDSDLPSENSAKNVEANPLPPSVNTSLSPTSMGFDSKPL